MDLATSGLLVFCAIAFHTDVIWGLEYVGSCKTTLKFSTYYTSMILLYNGAALYNSSGIPCDAEVKIKHIANTKANICVLLNYGYDMCRHSVRFYYAEDPDQYYTCYQIEQKAVCQESETVILLFKPWDYTGNDISIKVYRETESERNLQKNSAAWYAGIVVGVIVIVIVIVFAAVKKKRIATDTTRPTVNQPRAQLTRYHSQEGYQCPDNSAEPPDYADVMAAQNLENNPSSTGYFQSVDTTDENEPREGQRSQEDAVPPSAPLDDETIPEDPPPPYPGYS